MGIYAFALSSGRHHKGGETRGGRMRTRVYPCRLVRTCAYLCRPARQRERVNNLKDNNQ